MSPVNQLTSLSNLLPTGTDLNSLNSGSSVFNQSLISPGNLLGNIASHLGLSASLDLPGLSDDVEISREPSGMVHIQAENDNDLFFSLGFVHASDRLWQMDYRRRIAAGRLSEVAGATTLQQDKLTRTLGLYEAAESAYLNLDVATKQIVDQYTNGINAYINLNLPLPIEFQTLGYRPDPWEPVDILAGLKLQSLGLSGNFQSELFRLQLISQGFTPEQIAELFPLYTGDSTILRPEDVNNIPGLAGLNTAALSSSPQMDLSALATPIDLSQMQSAMSVVQSMVSVDTMASNNWVVSGSRTTTGKPFLANDPHLTLEVPSLWYMAHLESPTFNAIGATLPGLPGVVIGHNNRISWGVTNLQADVQDLYIMAEVPGNQSAYLYGTDVRAYDIRQETIKVRGQADVVLPVRESIYGPVISDALGLPLPLSLQWVSLNETDSTLAAYIGINRAQNWTEFTQALESYVAPGQNFVYADVDGNIGYFAPGQIPIRRPGHTGLTPVLGTGIYDWQGFIPFDQLPQVLNPDSGFIVTANNRVGPSNYPYAISYEWAEPYRAERITELITSKPKLSLNDMQRIQLDQKTLLYRDFRPVLEQIQPLLNQASVPAATRQWLNRVLRWDGNVSTTSQTATVFEAWYNELTKLIAGAIGQPVLQGNQLEPAPRALLNMLTNGSTVLNLTSAQVLEKAAEAFQRVITQFGGSVPEWGDIHQAVFKHPILPITRQVEFGGDRYTINVGTYDSETLLMDRNGPSYRQIIDLSNFDNSRYIYPMGQSGNPISPFFDNLLPLWQRGRYLALSTEDYPIAFRLNLEPSTSGTPTIAPIFEIVNEFTDYLNQLLSGWLA